jgi:hypothetical protein
MKQRARKRARKRSRSDKDQTIPSDPRSKLKRQLLERFLVRFHMSLILSGIFASGIVTSKLLLELGVRSMLSRYLIAVVVSYALFFVFVRIWLWYVTEIPARDPLQSSVAPNSGDLLDCGDLPIDLIGGQGSASAASGPPLGGGGDFGGGGATDLWGSSDAAVPSAPTVSSGSGFRLLSSTSNSGGARGGSSGWDIDLGDEGVVLIAIGLLLLAILGGGVYLIYMAPEILAEAAFQAVLAAGLVKASRRMDEPGWMGSVFKSTWIPFVIVLTMTVAFGWAAHHYCPAATKLADIFAGCGSSQR